MKLADLFVKLGLKKDGFDQGLDSADKKVTSFGSTLKKVGGILAAAFAGRELVRFADKSLVAYNKQVSAEASLLVALKKRKGAQQELIELAGKLQEKTLFPDEDTIRAEANLAMLNLNKNAIKQLIPLVQDMATSLKMDLFTASTLVAKSVGSSTNALSRYGITIEGAANSQKRLKSAVNALTNAFGGQAQTLAKIGTGPLVQIKNLWGDFTEKIGGAISRSSLFQNVTAGLISILSGLNKVTAYHSDQLSEESEKVNLLAIKLTKLSTPEKERERIYQELKKINPEIVSGIDAQNVSISKLTKNLKKYNSEMVRRMAMEQASDKLKKQTRDVAAKTLEVGRLRVEIEKKLAEAQRDAYSRNKKVGDSITSIMLSSMSLQEKIEAVTRATGNASGNWGSFYDIMGEAGMLMNNRLVPATEAQQKAQKRLNEAVADYEKVFKQAFSATSSSTGGGGGAKGVVYNSNIMGQAILAAKENIKDAENAYKEFLNTPGKFHGEQTAQDFIDKLKKLQDNIVKAQMELLELQGQGTGSTSPKLDKVSMDITPKLKVSSIDWGPMDDKLSEGVKRWLDFNNQLNQVIQQGMTDAVTTLAEGIGKLFAGTMTGKDFGKSLLMMVGRFMEQLGGLMVTIGIGMLQLDAGLKSMNPFLVIAGGALLIAAGAAISGLASKGVSGSAGAASAGSFNYAATSGAGTRSILAGDVTFRLKGSTLVGVLNSTDTKNSLIR